MSATLKTHSDKPMNDRSALLMMLAYIEAECRRMGAEAAAHHAALAAALVPDGSEGVAIACNAAAVH